MSRPHPSAAKPGASMHPASDSVGPSALLDSIHRLHEHAGRLHPRPASPSATHAIMAVEFARLTASPHAFVAEVVFSEEGTALLTPVATHPVPVGAGTAAAPTEDPLTLGAAQVVRTVLPRLLSGELPGVCSTMPLTPDQPVCRWCALPIRIDDRIAGIIVACNRSTDYPTTLTSELQPFLSTCGLVWSLWHNERRRKRAEQALQESRERLHAISLTGTMGTWVWDITSQSLRWDEGLAGLFGRGLGEVVDGRVATLIECLHPEDRSPFSKALARSGRGDGDLSIEARVVRPGGEVRWINIRGHVEKDSQGRPVRMVAGCLDITDRRRAEFASTESEDRFRQVAESINGVFWLSTPDRRQLVYVSPSFEKVWGIPCERLYADPDAWLSALHPEDRAKTRQSATARQFGGSHDQEYRILRPDGFVRWIRDRSFPVKDRNGVIQRVAGIAEDITEQKRLEGQVLQAQKLQSLGRLAGGVAHDFNNLMTAVGSFARLALDSLPPENGARADIEQVIKAADRAAIVTRQLLAFARQQTMRTVVMEPDRVLRNLQTMLSRLIREDVEMSIQTGPDLGRIRVDPVVVEQALVNLAVNACDAMPQGGKLRIDVRNVLVGKTDPHVRDGAKPGRYVCFGVADTGVGIPKEVLDHIFEPFFTTKEVGKGAGLGLAMVYGFANQTGGFVEVASQVGQGTTVQLYIPATEEMPSVEATLPAPAQRSTTETILVAEDEPDVRKLVSQILRQHGYTVIEACNGEEALQRAQLLGKARIDLLLTDVVMPRMNGRQLALELSSLRPDMKVVFMTGYTEEDLTGIGLPGRLLSKPFTPAQLLLAIRSAG